MPAFPDGPLTLAKLGRYQEILLGNGFTNRMVYAHMLTALEMTSCRLYGRVENPRLVKHNCRVMYNFIKKRRGRDLGATRTAIRTLNKIEILLELVEEEI